MRQRLDNRIHLPDEQLASLAEGFDRLQYIADGLPQRVMRYVVDGEDEAVITELPALLAANVGGSYVPYDFYQKSPHSGFFERVSITDVGFFFRLAQVYGALYRNKSPYQSGRLSARPPTSPHL